MTLHLLSALLFLSAAAIAVETPNIVLIFTDDQGYGDVGVMGAKGFTTPNLDRLAAEGRTFTNFHVAQPVCSASRAALLTGCYPNRVGIHGALGPRVRHGLAQSEMTLAELLKQKNYATGMAGKWHLGSLPQLLPTHHGFDEYFGLPYSNDMWPHHPEAKRGSYPPLPLIEGDQPIKVGLDAADQEQLTTQYTERAVKFIERNKGGPFFFYLAHSMPHVPLHVSDKFRGKSAQGLYGDVIMEIDWSVGEIMRALERHGIAEKTLVIFTSDNGPWLSYGDHGGSAGPLREGKGTTWEGGTRVPCIMRWPGRIPAGTKSDAMLMTIDLFPTLAAITGATLPPQKIDGLDVLANPHRRRVRQKPARRLCLLLPEQPAPGGHHRRRTLEAPPSPHLPHPRRPPRRHRRQTQPIRAARPFAAAALRSPRRPRRNQRRERGKSPGSAAAPRLCRKAAGGSRGFAHQAARERRARRIGWLRRSEGVRMHSNGCEMWGRRRARPPSAPR